MTGVSADPADAFSSVPPQDPVALVDLAETEAPQETRTLATQIAEIAEAAGGRMVLANEAIAPMIVPDESTGSSDDAIRLLVVSHYPTREAGARPPSSSGTGGTHRCEATRPGPWDASSRGSVGTCPERSAC